MYSKLAELSEWTRFVIFAKKGKFEAFKSAKFVLVKLRLSLELKNTCKIQIVVDFKNLFGMCITIHKHK
jgi:hypothetical protein